MALRFRLNRLQRGILIASAGIMSVIQLTSIADHGLDENRGWVWALLAAAGLLVIGLSPNSPPEAGIEPQAARRPAPLKSPPTEVMERFAAQMTAASRIVLETERIGARLHEFVMAKNLYHESGPIVWVLHPGLSSVLAAHSLVALAVDEAKVRVDPLLWGTYRTTLAHRLAQKRAELFPEMTRALQDAGAGGAARIEKVDRAYIDLANGEIELWEEVARKSVSEEPNRKHAGLLAHFAATFGGRQGPQDDARFESILSECYSDARQRAVPILALGT